MSQQLGDGTSPHRGFDRAPDRPWASPALVGGADYGQPYGEMVDALTGFHDALAEAVPDLDQVEALRLELTEWTARLRSGAVPERERVFGRRVDLDGRGQTMAPKLRVVRADAQQVFGRVAFGPYWLGGNGAVHGGAVPMLFDEVLGRLAQTGGRPASRTAYLKTDFRAVVPIGADLEVEGKIERMEGRKLFARATLHHGTTLCAEAEALFVTLDPGQQ
jgi:acyl-coenzyme A thioesterase PaaI-like protein